MNKCIIFPNNDGGVSIVFPVLNCGLTIEQIAEKDVPSEKPYKIIDISQIPQDPIFREAWEYQE